MFICKFQNRNVANLLGKLSTKNGSSYDLNGRKGYISSWDLAMAEIYLFLKNIKEKQPKCYILRLPRNGQLVMSSRGWRGQTAVIRSEIYGRFKLIQAPFSFSLHGHLSLSLFKPTPPNPFLPNCANILFEIRRKCSLFD